MTVKEEELQVPVHLVQLTRKEILQSFLKKYQFVLQVLLSLIPKALQVPHALAWAFNQLIGMCFIFAFITHTMFLTYPCFDYREHQRHRQKLEDKVRRGVSDQG